MTAKDFRSFISTATECRIVVSLVAGADAVEIKCTKTALRNAIKGVSSFATVNATFREDDGTLVMRSGGFDTGMTVVNNHTFNVTTPAQTDVTESDNDDMEMPEVVEG